MPDEVVTLLRAEGDDRWRSSSGRPSSQKARQFPIEQSTEFDPVLNLKTAK
jgi:hypothetical protein